jgi:glycosyltransferase involved in cell wall biosynthesis
MIHIGIDARMTYYRTGGISTYIRRLVAALERLDSDNQYTIFHSRKMRESITTQFSRADLWTPSHHRLERLALAVELARHKLDVYHATDFIPPRKLRPRRTVISIHDLNFLHYPQFLTGDSRRYYNGQINRAAAEADHILTISESSKRDIVQLLNVPPEKVTVHTLAADESFQPLPASEVDRLLAPLDLPNEYFLFVGTFEPRKNLIGLLDAYSLLRLQTVEPPPLVLAGNRGWLFDEIFARVDILGLKKHVLWRENISPQALPALYNRAFALVMPSFYEGFGLPALEAMACGTLPIVSDRSSLPEVVGDVGLQVNPDDPQALASALYRALVDVEWRAAQRTAGLARSREFTWERAARIALSVYKAVV